MIQQQQQQIQIDVRQCFPEELFIDEGQVKNFLCPINLGVVNDPVVDNHGHMFCRQCINQWLDKKRACPVNSSEDIMIIEQQISLPLRNFLLEQKVHCFLKNDGCNFKDNLENLINHFENKCEFKEINCVNSQLGCKDNFKRGQLIDHLKNICLFRIEQCIQCQQQFPFQQLQNHVENMCEMRLVECEFCKLLIQSGNILNHNLVCDKYPLQCKFQCEALIPREQMKGHQLSNIELHIGKLQLSVQTLTDDKQQLVQQLQAQNQRLDQCEQCLHFTNTSKLLKSEKTLSEHKQLISNICVLDDLGLFMTVSADHSIKLWDPHHEIKQNGVVSHPSLLTWGAQNNSIMTSICYLFDQNRVATGNNDNGNIILWKFKENKIGQTPKGTTTKGNNVGSPFFNVKHQTLTGHTKNVYALAPFQDGRRFASASWDSTIRIWDADADEQQANINSIQVFEPQKQHQQQQQQNNKDLILVMNYLKGQNQLIIGTKEATIATYDAQSSKMVQQVLSAHSQKIYAFSQMSQNSMVSSSFDKSVCLWDLRQLNKNNSALVCKQKGAVYAVACLPDGNRVASAGQDRIILIHDVRYLQNKQFEAILSGHQEIVNCLAVMPTFDYLLSGSGDNTVKIWN